MRHLVLVGLLAVGAEAKTVALKIYPPEVRFHAGEGQKILVVATDEEGVSREVTAEAAFRAPASVQMEAGHTVKSTEQGTVKLRATFEGLSTEAAVEVLKPRGRELSFVNDIVPVFTRADCANSNCHGSVRGQKGFKLSLFGSDPDVDHDAITIKADGKRIDKANPENSLVLRKPAFQEPHGGGQRFKVGSDDYKLLLEWLKRGTPYDAAGQARLRALTVYPPSWRMVGVGSKVQLVAVGEYNDGSVRDLTSAVAFSSNIVAIASVKPGGLVSAEQSGEATIMARTLGRAAAVPLLVVNERTLKNYPAVAENNFIDKHVFAKLRMANVVPSPLSTDAEFLRRVYLDTVGSAPTIEEARAFLSSKDSKKREVLIDQLLQRPERADMWSMRFSDMYRAGYNEAGQKGGGAYGRWFRDKIRQDVPYDEMVRSMLVSQGRHDFEGISNFYFVSREITPEESGVNVSQLLLGLQIECARCHNHPFEKWKQDDFYGFAAFFARVSRKDIYLNNHNGTYLKESGEVLHPKTNKAVTPKYLDGDFESEAPGQDVREKLAKWVTAPTNPYFARATVNRFWKFFLGRGIVEQVDDFRVTNPPSNEALLDALAKEFAAGGYSIKRLERAILNSRTYQLSSVANETNRKDQVNYSHFLVRRLMAEQLADTMAQVTGVPIKFPTQPLGKRAMSIPVLNFGKPQYMLKVFGRNDLREVICERDTKPSVAQVMHLVSGDTIQQQVTAKDGKLDAWLADSTMRDRQIVENIYLSALTRMPEADEISAALSPPGDRRRAFEDLLWTVFNSKEFLFQQ